MCTWIRVANQPLPLCHARMSGTYGSFISQRCGHFAHLATFNGRHIVSRAHRAGSQNISTSPEAYISLVRERLEQLWNSVQPVPDAQRLRVDRICCNVHADGMLSLVDRLPHSSCPALQCVRNREDYAVIHDFGSRVLAPEQSARRTARLRGPGEDCEWEPPRSAVQMTHHDQARQSKVPIKCYLRVSSAFRNFFIQRTSCTENWRG